MNTRQTNYDLEVEIFTQLSRQTPRRSLGQRVAQVIHKAANIEREWQPKLTTAELKRVH